jgi:hypothetical protein
MRWKSLTSEVTESSVWTRFAGDSNRAGCPILSRLHQASQPSPLASLKATARPSTAAHAPTFTTFNGRPPYRLDSRDLYSLTQSYWDSEYVQFEGERNAIDIQVRSAQWARGDIG